MLPLGMRNAASAAAGSSRNAVGPAGVQIAARPAPTPLARRLQRSLPTSAVLSVRGAAVALSSSAAKAGRRPLAAAAPLVLRCSGSSRGIGRYATPCARPLDADKDLFEDMFQPFGVSKEQFQSLMGHGTRCRAAPGGTIVEGGVPWTRVCLVIRGTAIAYRFTPDSVSETDRGSPVCKYAGRLQHDEVADAYAQVPTRGSMIGGSSLVDTQVSSRPYPSDVVALTPCEWIEWELEDLKRLADAPKWRAVQASLYYNLYVELIGTLDRERAGKIHEAQRATKAASSTALVKSPSARQLLQLGIFVAVPFVGFGFADNFIMILCGDAIDSHFGTTLGLTTLAAAGLGNWVSDVCGLGIGDAIERTASRLGLSNGKLTPAQEKLQIAKLTTLSAKVIGITAGCFLGMLPLLFLTPSKTEFANEDLEIFDIVFSPHGVATSQFADLMAKGKKQWVEPGTCIVEGGVPFPKVLLVLRGEARAYPYSEGAAKGQTPPQTTAKCKYVGRMDAASSDAGQHSRGQVRAVPSRGSMIGGSAFADSSLSDRLYPNNVIAVTPVEYVEWDMSELKGLMADEKAIQASFYSMLYGELLSGLNRDKKSASYKKYQALLSAVVVDGIVDTKERALMSRFRVELDISEQEHFELLQELGWSREGWEAGTMGRHPLFRSPRLSDAAATPTSLAESTAQLQQAVALIDGVVRSFQGGEAEGSEE